MKVTEGVAGTWYYHISENDNPCHSLCGELVMNTLLPLSSWGRRSHLNERYCAKCEKLAQEKAASDR